MLLLRGVCWAPQLWSRPQGRVGLRQPRTQLGTGRAHTMGSDGKVCTSPAQWSMSWGRLWTTKEPRNGTIPCQSAQRSKSQVRRQEGSSMDTVLGQSLFLAGTRSSSELLTEGMVTLEADESFSPILLPWKWSSLTSDLPGSSLIARGHRPISSMLVSSKFCTGQKEWEKCLNQGNWTLTRYLMILRN
jgi:hypothetical protein